MSRTPLRYSLFGGAIAGALDILYAILLWGFRGVDAQSILQSVASGLLGRRAYEGGVPTAVLGLITHFVLMFVIAVIFYFVTRRIDWVCRNAVTAGVIYGIAVYWVMNLIVLPLSAYPGEFSFDPIDIALGLLAHAFLIGVPIAFATRAGQVVARD